MAMSCLALALMVCCTTIMLWLAAFGDAPLQTVALWAALSVSGLLGATLLIRTGRTLGWSDPALTLFQMLWAITSIASAYLVATNARSMLPCMVAMVLLFGSLGLRPWQIVGVTLYAFCSTVTAMLLNLHDHQGAPSAHDAAHAMMVTMVLLACMAVSLRLHRLRTRLQHERQALSLALKEHRNLASRDPLTGLLNRRSMQELLELEQRRCLRGQRNMALAMLDIDHFKRINDSHGHAMGDLALQNFALTLRQTLRGSDVLARWGGEEFVLLISDVDAPTAHALLERAGQVVAAAAVPGAPAQLRITVSAGIAQFLPGEPVESTLRRADAALYQAKHQGRNQVVSAGSMLPAPALAPVTAQATPDSPPACAPATAPAPLPGTL